jgi:hypothetical protein
MYTTHDAAARTATHNGTKSKRLKVLPQLSAELWREILRLRSMQIEVLREEKLNRHDELGYNAVIDELHRLQYEREICFYARDHHDYITPRWIQFVHDSYKTRNPRKRTKRGTLYRQWEQYLPHRRCVNVRLLYICADELRADTFSNQL